MMNAPVVYMHSSEDMAEVQNASAHMFLGASVYLGRDAEWDAYEQLYQRVYVEEGLRIIRPDGVFVVLMTNAYWKGRFVWRTCFLTNLLLRSGWEAVDERVWQRSEVNLYQVPFSHVMVFRPAGGTATRAKLNKNKRWLRGIWNYPQVGKKLNSYPADLCRLLVEACTSEGSLVVDCFAGTGRLLGVAASMGRYVVGYEIDNSLVRPCLRTDVMFVCPMGNWWVQRGRGSVYEEH